MQGQATTDVKESKMTKMRYYILDDLRGITLISMICFHAVWDLVYIFGMNWRWFYTSVSYWWQQSICWTFILLSGFCWSLGTRKLRRGILVLMAGFIVSLVTEIAAPDQRVRFGVLTLLGVCMLLMIPLEQLLNRVPAWIGCIGSLFLFMATRNINDGYLGFEGLNLVELPEEWYCMGDMMTLVGFTDRRFYSTDYFSIFPWIFLFITGYFGYCIMKEKELLQKMAGWKPFPEYLGIIGRQSLLIYMLHQPIIYGGLSVFFLVLE